LLDLKTFARRGPAQRLSPFEVEQIRRTVTRTPEVMVKVLSQPAATTGQVGRHVDYVSRNGQVELETDDGRRLKERDAGTDLIEDWNLDVPLVGSAEATARGRSRTPRLVHKLVFSMPHGTPPQKVRTAVQAFAREEFSLKHRYVMALHTDEPHPHVHLIVKAVSEQGDRLNIRKETLRSWRAGFAAQLRAQGVSANATERAARGSTHQNRKTGIYRAAKRGESTFLWKRASAVSRSPGESAERDQAAKAQLLESRRQVEAGWWALAEAAHRSGLQDVAREITRFVEQLPRVRTDQETQTKRPREKYFEDRERSR
jgi:hypothetical protein